jgi:hypothetical protein
MDKIAEDKDVEHGTDGATIANSELEMETIAPLPTFRRRVQVLSDLTGMNLQELGGKSFSHADRLTVQDLTVLLNMDPEAVVHHAKRTRQKSSSDVLVKFSQANFLKGGKSKSKSISVPIIFILHIILNRISLLCIPLYLFLQTIFVWPRRWIPMAQPRRGEKLGVMKLSPLLALRSMMGSNLPTTLSITMWG